MTDFQFKTWEEALLNEYKARVTGIAQNILVSLLTAGAVKHMIARNEEGWSAAALDDESLKELRPVVERSILMAKYLCELAEDLSLPPKIRAKAREYDAEAARDEALAAAQREGRKYQCYVCGGPTSAIPQIVKESYYPSYCLTCIERDQLLPRPIPLADVSPELIAALPASAREV